jgi:hypothetical protein
MFPLAEVIPRESCWRLLGDGPFVRIDISVLFFVGEIDFMVVSREALFGSGIMRIISEGSLVSHAEMASRKGTEGSPTMGTMTDTFLGVKIG